MSTAMSNSATGSVAVPPSFTSRYDQSGDLDAGASMAETQDVTAAPAAAPPALVRTVCIYPNREASKVNHTPAAIPDATPPLPRWRAVWKVRNPPPTCDQATTPPARDDQHHNHDIDQRPAKLRKVTFCDPQPQKAPSPRPSKPSVRTHADRQRTAAKVDPSAQQFRPRDRSVTTAWGKLVTMFDSCQAYSTMYMLSALTSLGRSRSCTYKFNYLNISRVHLRIILAHPDDDRPLENLDVKKWRPEPSMCAWINVEASNGCRINGEMKIKGYIGRIYNGDMLQIAEPGEFFTYRCEFSIGDHKRPEASVEGGSKKHPRPETSVGGGSKKHSRPHSERKRKRQDEEVVVGRSRVRS